MKKILIAGTNSFIGTSFDNFENFVAAWSDEYSVDTVDMIISSWREKDFSVYDVVLYVAEIAIYANEKSYHKKNLNIYK